MSDELDFGSYHRKTLGLDRLPPASRAKDPPTAKAAGDSFEKRGLSELHEAVLAALRERPMTDEELETLPQFQHLAPSTARKRRSELLYLSKIRQVGSKINSRHRAMILWGPA